MRLSAIIVAFLLTVTCLGGCDSFGSDDSFIPGEVAASVQHVKPAFIEAYAEEHEIAVKSVFFPSVYLVQTVVRTGAAEDYLAALTADPLVDTARIWKGEGVEIVVQRAADDDYVQTLVASQGGLDVVNVFRGQDLVLFGVPKGQESKWVRRLIKEVFVVTAEQNQMVSVR